MDFNKITYIVKIGYRPFKFTDRNDAIMFASIAKNHQTEDIEVSITLTTTWDEEEDPEDEEELREGQ